MADLGYTQVKEYAGGKRDWIDAGLPVETNGDEDMDGATEVEVAEA